MNIRLGSVTSIVDSSKFIIRFSVPKFIEDQIAYPMDVYDEPNIGDPIVLFELESVFGLSYMYSKERLRDFTRLKIGESTVELKNDKINIKSNGGNVVVDAKGDIIIKSASTLSIKSDSNLSIESTGDITVKGGKVSLIGSKVEMPNRTPIATGTGPFNCIPVCPFTGQPHSSNFV